MSIQMQLSITVQSQKLICLYKNLQNGIMLQDCELWMLSTEQHVTIQRFSPTLLYYCIQAPGVLHYCITFPLIQVHNRHLLFWYQWGHNGMPK